MNFFDRLSEMYAEMSKQISDQNPMSIIFAEEHAKFLDGPRITTDDVLDLKILLETTHSVQEFLETLKCE